MRVKGQSGITTRYFEHYEDLENAFRRRIATLLPRKHAGTALFWRDFQQSFHALTEQAARRREHYITINPRDCLAFGTPRQVLQAELMTSAPSPMSGAADLTTVARRFGLRSHLNQPVRSLSGGETVRLALAKAFIGAVRAHRLTLASPFSWLSLNNRRYFHDLAGHCRDQGKALEVFAMTGEDDTSVDGIRADLTSGPEFRLFFRGARVALNSVLDRLHHQRLRAVVEDGEFNLCSPCLIQGDNGQGKSLVAKLLARAMPGEGRAGLERAAGAGRVRLLLQDLINQTMMRSFRQLALGPRSDAAQRTRRLYDAIRSDMMNSGALAPGEIKTFDEGCATRRPATLIDLKILLAALRLATDPVAIVMDEPDWGLRQTTALLFVRAVIRTAHAAGLPVLLISHKPWWHTWAGSVLQVRKTHAEQAEAASDLFRIALQRTSADP